MKRFTFSLDSVLKLKEQMLNNTQTELAKINEAIALQEKVEAENRETHKNNDSQYREQQMKGIRPHMMQYYTDYREQLHKEYQVILHKKEALMKDKNAVIDKIVNFKVEIASLEKLKEKEWQNYQVEARKEEERIVEEFIGFTRTSASA